jgi:ketosteroid isomerase-like protein
MAKIATATSLKEPIEVWQQHCYFEFVKKDSEAALGLVPGVPPTGNRVEAGVVGIITFENGRIASEHLYRDHASVLAQLGVLDPSKLPVKGNESPRTLLQGAGVTPVNK